jgi:Putative lumazine-binding
MSTMTEWHLNQEDILAITNTSRDYVEGWYTADAERVRRCLHPDLVKRTLAHDPGSGAWYLNRPTGADKLVSYTQAGGGSAAGEPGLKFEITILDTFRHIAAVKVLSLEYMDYLHLARLDDRWLIVNVLWELREGEVQPGA